MSRRQINDPRERFELVNRVGRGANGSVYRAWDLVEECEVAIKVVNLGEDLDDVHQEITLMAQVSCPQLVKYHCSYIVMDTLWIVMAHCDCGSLSGTFVFFPPSLFVI